MTRLRRSISTIAIAVLTLALASPAHAGYLTARFDEVTPGVGSAGVYQFQVEKAEHDANPHFVYNSGLTNNWIGSHHYTNVYLMRAFCIQFNPVQYIHANEEVKFEVKSLSSGPIGGTSTAMGATAAADVKKMWAQYGSAANLDTNYEAAAFQYAVWHEINQFDSNGDGLEISNSTIRGYYKTYIDSSTWKSGSANLVALTNPDTQDYVVEVDSHFPNPPGSVPAPPALILALGGILPGLALRRKLRGQPA